jgi:hypothetical protein
LLKQFLLSIECGNQDVDGERPDPDDEQANTHDMRRLSLAGMIQMVSESSAFDLARCYEVSSTSGQQHRTVHHVFISPEVVTLCSCLEQQRMGLLCPHVVACTNDELQERSVLPPPTHTCDLPDASSLSSLAAAIQKLRDSDTSALFEDEVTDSMAPGYSTIILSPMCWSVMAKKLEEGGYYGPDKDGRQGFASDAALVYNNCLKYNKKGSNIWAIANEGSRQLPSILGDVASAVHEERGGSTWSLVAAEYSANLFGNTNPTWLKLDSPRRTAFVMLDNGKRGHKSEIVATAYKLLTQPLASLAGGSVRRGEDFYEKEGGDLDGAAQGLTARSKALVDADIWANLKIVAEQLKVLPGDVGLALSKRYIHDAKYHVQTNADHALIGNPQITSKAKVLKGKRGRSGGEGAVSKKGAAAKRGKV